MEGKLNGIKKVDNNKEINVISNLFYPVELFVDGSKGLSPTI
jgi:hypothetical protein